MLVVDDEAGVRSLASRILRDNGYTVLEAADVGEAVLASQRHDGVIHLVLTDVMLPRTGGREMAERLRAIRPRLTVLYMSGYTPTAVVRHGVIDAGAAFVQKPFTPATLARAQRATDTGAGADWM